MLRTALLCWEAGHGRGHALSLLQIAGKLDTRGWRSVLALPEDRNPGDIATGRVPVCFAPRWGEGRPALGAVTKSSASMADMLAQIGLQSADWTRHQIERWRRLFDEHQPDVIVADYAPGAVLAARGRVQCVATGVGFTVPPAAMRRFPLLGDSAPAVYDEATILETVNDVLVERGGRPLTALPQALIGDLQCVCSLPLLDPYRAYRADPPLGPQFNTPILRRSRHAAEVFCYLREPAGVERLAEIVVGLQGLGVRVIVYLPGLDPQVAAGLRDNGVEVRQAPVPIAEQLARSRLIVHYGGHGTAAAALLAGVPQIILPFDIEKVLIAEALAGRGVARTLPYLTVEADELRDAILSALQDEEMGRHADAAAEEHSGYDRRDVAGDVAEAVERLTGSARPY